ncbi:MAG: hypothetical protein J07HX64_00785 [halophilic archaeon J07HX64]|nr:MAG: hypothetical protein J07HX64_00785 [halophilic archaeon J07HX64]
MHRTGRVPYRSVRFRPVRGTHGAGRYDPGVRPHRSFFEAIWFEMEPR